MPGFEYTNLGFIGIGAMGQPMIGHLATKLPAETEIHIYDISDEVVQKVCDAYPGRISKGSSAKDVANKSVRSRIYG